MMKKKLIYYMLFFATIITYGQAYNDSFPDPIELEQPNSDSSDTPEPEEPIDPSLLGPQDPVPIEDLLEDIDEDLPNPNAIDNPDTLDAPNAPDNGGYIEDLTSSSVSNLDPFDGDPFGDPLADLLGDPFDNPFGDPLIDPFDGDPYGDGSSSSEAGTSGQEESSGEEGSGDNSNPFGDLKLEGDTSLGSGNASSNDTPTGSSADLESIVDRAHHINTNFNIPNSKYQPSSDENEVPSPCDKETSLPTDDTDFATRINAYQDIDTEKQREDTDSEETGEENKSDYEKYLEEKNGEEDTGAAINDSGGIIETLEHTVQDLEIASSLIARKQYHRAAGILKTSILKRSDAVTYKFHAATITELLDKREQLKNIASKGLRHHALQSIYDGFKYNDYGTDGSNFYITKRIPLSTSSVDYQGILNSLSVQNTGCSVQIKVYENTIQHIQETIDNPIGDKHISAHIVAPLPVGKNRPRLVLKSQAQGAEGASGVAYNPYSTTNPYSLDTPKQLYTNSNGNSEPAVYDMTIHITEGNIASSNISEVFHQIGIELHKQRFYPTQALLNQLGRTLSDTDKNDILHAAAYMTQGIVGVYKNDITTLLEHLLEDIALFRVSSSSYKSLNQVLKDRLDVLINEGQSSSTTSQQFATSGGGQGPFATPISGGGDTETEDLSKVLESFNSCEECEVDGANEDCECPDNQMPIDNKCPDKKVWYKDGDSDGWGDDNHTKETYTKPEGYVDKGGDCDDTDPLKPYVDSDIQLGNLIRTSFTDSMVNQGEICSCPPGYTDNGGTTKCSLVDCNKHPNPKKVNHVIANDISPMKQQGDFGKGHARLEDIAVTMTPAQADNYHIQPLIAKFDYKIVLLVNDTGFNQYDIDNVTSESIAQSYIDVFRSYYSNGAANTSVHDVAATDAHEEYHKKEYTCVVNKVHSLTKQLCDSNLICIYDDEGKVKSNLLQEFQDIVIDITKKVIKKQAELESIILSRDYANGPAYSAGQSILNQNIEEIIQKGNDKGWNLSGESVNVKDENPCNGIK